MWAVWQLSTGALSGTDLAWLVQDKHLSREASCFYWWVIFAITSHTAMMNIVDKHILDIETQEELHSEPHGAFQQILLQF